MPKITEYTIFRGSPSGSITTETIKRPVESHEALVEITYAGICGSDKANKHKDIPLGHHGTGKVIDVGDHVEQVSIGDYVGFAGKQRPCGHCDPCIGAKEQFCEHRGEFEKVGSFATHAVWHETRLTKLPEGLDPKYAASLMCGGAIVWEVLASYDMKPGERLGVHGVGGLGHVAIQMSNSLGCEVVAFARSPSKRDDAIAFGAHEFHVTQDFVPQTPVAPVQHLLWCSDAAPDFSKVLPQVACGGVVYVLSASPHAVLLPMQTLVSNGIRIQGTGDASRKTVRKMLQYIRVRGIEPAIMTWPMTVDGIEDAFRTLAEGKMRYRGVLVAQSAQQNEARIYQKRYR